MHNFTVSAQDIFTFRRLSVFRNFASSNDDKEMCCTVLLTSQVVIMQSLQPKGREFESTCGLFFSFIQFVYFYLL